MDDIQLEEENTPESPILLHSNRFAQPLPTMDESFCDSFPTLAYIDNLLPESYQNNYSQISSVLNFNQPFINNPATSLEEECTSQNWNENLSKALKLRSKGYFSESTLSKTALTSILVYWGIKFRIRDKKSDLYKIVSDVIDIIRQGGSTSFGRLIDQRIRYSISLCSSQDSETFNYSTNHLIKCCKCKKWQKVPTSIALESLPSNWSCPLNTWDLSLAKCLFPPERDGAFINAKSYSQGDSTVQQGLTEIADEDPTEKAQNSLNKQKKKQKHDLLSVGPTLLPAVAKKRTKSGSSNYDADNVYSDLIIESLSSELWNPENWFSTSASGQEDRAVDWVACADADRDICNASAFDPHTYYRLIFQTAKQCLSYDPHQDHNRLLKRAKLQSSKGEGRPQPPTLSDTVARYKAVTLVNISNPQLGIVFSKSAGEEGGDDGTCLCIQELRADLLDEEVKDILHLGDRLVSINAHSVAEWAVDHQLAAMQHSNRPICLGFTPAR